MPLATWLGPGRDLRRPLRLDRSIRLDKFIARTWPDDGDVPLILKASVGPMMQEDAPALQAISLGLPSGIVPQSAGADLFGRFRPT